MLRNRVVEAVVTKLFWAPNVASTKDEMRSHAHAASLSVEKIESPSALGQSIAVFRKA